jgi:hypothetical protein
MIAIEKEIFCDLEKLSHRTKPCAGHRLHGTLVIIKPYRQNSITKIVSMYLYFDPVAVSSV